MMTGDDTLEREVFEHFKRQYLSLAQDHADDEIYKVMVAHRYGPGARDPMIPINWDIVIGRRHCPECDDLIVLGESSYVCGKCGLRIPQQLFDKAQEEYRRKQKIREDDAMYLKKMSGAGYSQHRIEAIYNTAVNEALEELKAKRRREASSTAPTSSQKAGSSLTREVDEKK